MRNGGALAGPRRRRRRRGAGARRRATAPSRCRRRRSRPSCSGWSSTWPPTSGSRPQASAAQRPRRSRARRCSPTRWSASGTLAEELLEPLLEAPRGGAAYERRPCSPSTAATRRPTSRSSRDDGALLALVRGPQSSPHHLGVERLLDVLERLLGEAAARGRRDGRRSPTSADVHARRRRLPERGGASCRRRSRRGAGRQRAWSATTPSPSCAPAPSAAGASRSSAAPGSTASASRPDGRHARFPALGAITGDWGGGYDVGLAALAAAARSEDGRGPRTTLERAVPAHFGLETPHELAEAIHRGRDPGAAAARAAAGRASPRRSATRSRPRSSSGSRARSSRWRASRSSGSSSSDEPRRGAARRRPARSGDGRLIERDRGRAARGSAPGRRVRRADSPPIVGAALLGLDALGAGPRRRRALRAELEAAVAAEPRRRPMAEVRFEQATKLYPGDGRAGASTRST